MQALIADQRAFDYLCWDLYARISRYYKEHPEALAVARATRCMPSKQGEGEDGGAGAPGGGRHRESAPGDHVRLDIEYDVLPRESEILHLQFWATAFELLKERKAIYFETEGKNAGCWVMPASAFSRESAKATKTAR